MNEMPSTLSTSSHTLSMERLDSKKFRSSAKLTNLKLATWLSFYQKYIKI